MPKIPGAFFLAVLGDSFDSERKGRNTRVRLFFSRHRVKKNSSSSFILYPKYNHILLLPLQFRLVLCGRGLVNEQSLVPTLRDGCTKRNQAS